MVIDVLKKKFRGSRIYDIVDKNSYDIILENLCESKNSFSILKTPSSKEISIQGVKYGICLLDNAIKQMMSDRELKKGYITNKIFKDSMIEITKDLYQNITRILRTDEIIEIKKTKLYPEEKIDFIKWEVLPRNWRMYMMDIDRMYWYTAYHLGYISEKIFKHYEYDDDYKDICNISLGRLCSNKEVCFYIKGKPIYETIGNEKKLYTIRSNYQIDNKLPLFHLIYNNIVTQSKNIIGKIADHFKDRIYGCGIDNIYLPPDKDLMHDIGEFVRSLGYNCKFETVYKHSDTEIRVIDDIDNDGNCIWGYPRKMNFFNLPSNNYNNSSKTS
jgi:hypothetical protein